MVLKINLLSRTMPSKELVTIITGRGPTKRQGGGGAVKFYPFENGGGGRKKL